MAGMQSRFRGVFIKSSLRFMNKNGVHLQSTRRQHLLAFQMAVVKNTQTNRISRLLLNPHLKYRFASTSGTSLETTDKLGTVKSPSTGVSSSDIGTSNSSNSNIVIDESTLPPVPLPPGDENAASEVLEFVSKGLKEPSFESLGLGSYWPPGILQQVLEFLHISFDLPWWGAISIVTVVFRLCLIPVAAKARVNTVNMANNMPQFQHLQMKMTNARQTGNYYEAAVCVQELQEFMKEKKIMGLATFAPTLIQAPIFISMYLGLKKMAAVPVESMKTGGLFWFEDLTLPDPYYILPLYMASSLLAVIEVGADGAAASSMTNMWVKYGLRAFPFIILPFTVSFPSAILWYWSVSNTLTLCQVLMFKIPVVGKFFGIPKAIKHDPSIFRSKKKGFVEGFKEGMTNLKITKELEDRERLNTSTFEKAGLGPVPRTFKTNPRK